MLFPSRCPACDALGPAPCAACWRELEAAPPAPPPDGVDHCLALLRYAGPGRELVARLKYRNSRAAVRWLAGGMAALVAAFAVDVVAWVPTTPSRRRERGFDQAGLLAGEVARTLHVPIARPALLRRAHGPPQTGRTAAERLAGPPELTVPRRSPPAVLLVDDVVTTGATLSAAARALRQAGARQVVAVAAGRTPLKAGTGSADA